MPRNQPMMYRYFRSDGGSFDSPMSDLTHYVYYWGSHHYFSSAREMRAFIESRQLTQDDYTDGTVTRV